jgi:ParB-like chromosome segregation protein Spo0J
VQQWPLDRLKEYAGNPRKNDHAIDQAAKAIKTFGFRVPILAKSDGLIVDGHLRLKAARQLGLATVPVLLADDMTETQVRAFRLSVNKIADLAEWDADLLAFELDGLRDLEFDMSTIGFAPGELNDLIGTPNTGFDPDEVPPAPVVPVSRAGDLWLLGPKHRLLCGDSTRAADVARLMGGAKADLCFTSPPYANQRDYGGNVGDWDTLMQGVFAALPMAPAMGFTRLIIAKRAYSQPRFQTL